MHIQAGKYIFVIIDSVLLSAMWVSLLYNLHSIIMKIIILYFQVEDTVLPFGSGESSVKYFIYLQSFSIHNTIHSQSAFPLNLSPHLPALTLLFLHLLSLPPSLPLFLILSAPLCWWSQNSSIEPCSLIHLGLQYWLHYCSASLLWEKQLIMYTFRGADCI